MTEERIQDEADRRKNIAQMEESSAVLNKVNHLKRDQTASLSNSDSTFQVAADKAW